MSHETNKSASHAMPQDTPELSHNDCEGDPPTILIVDDDATLRVMISLIAKERGYVPIEASSYGQATTLLRQRTFDCVSLDLGLGSDSGKDLLDLIAQHETKTPVIIISGFDEDQRSNVMQVARHYNLNMYSPLVKPFDIVDLKLALTMIRMRTLVGLQANLT